MDIKSRLLLALVPAIIVMLALLAYINFKIGENIVLNQIKQESSNLLRFYAENFDGFFSSAEKVAEGLSTAVSTTQKLNEDSIVNLLKVTLQNNAHIYGSAVALKPSATRLGAFAPYFYRTGQVINYRDLTQKPYNYTKWKWFTEPLKENRGIWQDPYYDMGGGETLMTTYSLPITQSQQKIGVTTNDWFYLYPLDEKGETLGVVTVDFALDRLVKHIQTLRVGESGYAFIVTRSGKIIAHPDKSMLSEETITEMAHKINDKHLKKMAALLANPDPDFEEIVDPFHHQEAWFITAVIPSTGWTLALIYPRSEIMAPLSNLQDRLTTASAVIVILIILILWLSSTLTSPISHLVEQTKLFSQGKFTARLNENQGPREIRQLSRAFNAMGNAIIQYIDDLQKTTAEKESFHQELKFAAKVQQSILPHLFPPFPDLTTQIELLGFTKPAWEIGGDYYDYFRLSQDRIGLVIADVSGKGAPSAIFMAMTKILIKELSETHQNIEKMIARANALLARENTSNMFVTLLYCEYHINSGKLRCVCAGHPLPLVLARDGQINELKMKIGLPLGIEEHSTYDVAEFKLFPDETLILFTDGIPEARNTADEEFGVERFKNQLKPLNRLSSSELAAAIVKQVDAFCAGRPVLDDTTLVILKRLS